MRHVVGRQTLSYLLFGVLCLFLVTKSEAQTSQQFTGHVQDGTGAVVPRATVTVHSQLTNIDIKTVTTSGGIYTVTYLNPGLYTVSVAAAGFKTEAKTDITLNVDQVSTIDFILTVGSINEVVTVNASNAQIELSKADRGEIIDGERITEMPLNGRNPYNLFWLSPGTLDTSSSIYPRPYDDVTDNFKVNGGNGNIAINLDGITNDSGGGNSGYGTNPGIVPSVDALQEFKITLNPYDASQGHSAGASIDLALKSGGNLSHGTFDYFMRRTWLDAYGWQIKYSNPTKPVKSPHKRDQFSIEADGQLVIPHLFNSKNKLFYVINYEQMNDKTPSTGYNTYSIPNTAWLNGDFSTATYWNSITNTEMPIKIYDPLTPLTSVVDPNDGKTKLAHQQFANNIIPSSRIDSVGRALANMYKYVTPNYNPGAGNAAYTSNYHNLQVEDDTWRNALIKIDYNISDKDKLNFRWGAQGRWDYINSLTGFPDADPANMNQHQRQPQSQTGSVQWTHVFNPNLLLNFASTLMTVDNASNFGRKFSTDIYSTLGFSSSFYSQLQSGEGQHFPYITSGYAPLGYSNLGSSWVTHTLAFLPSMTYVHGLHSVKAGVDIRFNQADNPGGGTNNTLDFETTYTNEFYSQEYSEATGYSSGNSLASMLLGYPSSGTFYYNIHQFWSHHYFAPWIQDDWKISKKLTLNLGLRYDVTTPMVERHNQMTGRFNTTVINPVSSTIPSGSAALGNYPELMGGYEFAGVNGEPRGAAKTNMLDFQPRIGFAYAITPRMSIRGGIGDTYFIGKNVDGTDGFTSSTSYIASNDNGITPYTACATGSVNAGTCSGPGLTDPISTIIKPTGSSKGYLEDLGDSTSFRNPREQVPAIWSYSLTYEAGITKNDTLNVSYVGNHEPNAAVTDNINRNSPSWNAQCDIERGGNHSYCDNTSTGYITNPFKGVAGFKGTSYYTNSVMSKAIFTRPFPEFTDINEGAATNNQRFWNDSLQIIASHNAKGLNLHFAYTHLKSMKAGDWVDTTNRIVDREVNSSYTIRHQLALSGVAYLPFGQGRLFFSHVNRLTDQIINGWEISPLWTYYSGFNWRAGTSWEQTSTGRGITIPMAVKHKTLPADGSHSYMRIRGVNPCVGYKDTDTGVISLSPGAKTAGCSETVMVTKPNSYGLPRLTEDFRVTEPGAYKFDLSASKNFKLPEVYTLQNTSLQVRVDMFNAFNHPNWDLGYSTSSTDNNFGTISKGPSAPSNTPRYLQLSATLKW